MKTEFVFNNIRLHIDFSRVKSISVSQNILTLIYGTVSLMICIEKHMTISVTVNNAGIIEEARFTFVEDADKFVNNYLC